MAHTTQEWVAAVAKIRGYVKVYLGLKSLSAKQQAALQTDLRTLDKDLAELSASLEAAPTAEPKTYTPDEIWALFLDAEDAALKAQGKPYGRDGAERGGMTSAEHRAIVESLGIPHALATLESGGYSFGE